MEHGRGIFVYDAAGREYLEAKRAQQPTPSSAAWFRWTKTDPRSDPTGPCFLSAWTCSN